MGETSWDVNPHSHSHSDCKEKKPKGKSECKLIFMLCFTFAYFLVEIVVGYMANSMALVADSFHMLSDVVALFIAFISVKFSKRSWSQNTFGLARAEILGALINAVFLFALCFSIVVESIQRFFEPQTINRPDFVLYVGGFGLIVNLIGLGMFHTHSHGHTHGPPPAPKPKKSDRNMSTVTNNIVTQNNKKNSVEWTINADPIQLTSHIKHTQEENNDDEEITDDSNSAAQMNIHGVFLHILADALGSVVVIISALILWFTDWPYKEYVDPALSVLLVIVICYSTWPLFVESSHILLQTMPRHLNVTEIKDKIVKKVGKPIGFHDFYVWQLTGSKTFASTHVICSPLDDVGEIQEKISAVFRSVGISSTTVQLEITSDERSDNECLVQTKRKPKIIGESATTCHSHQSHHHHHAKKCCGNHSPNPPPFALVQNENV